MTYFGKLLAQPLPSETASAQQRSCVTYHLSSLSGPAGERAAVVFFPSAFDPRSITTLESRSLISGFGTTGLRTWEASLHLGEFLCVNHWVVTRKSVLELGCGTGYVSILCAKFLGATRVIASDGSDDVLIHLKDNLFLNGLEDSKAITPMDLKWGHALVGTEEPEWNGGRPIDVVLGADITYDDRLVTPLVSTMSELTRLNPAVVMYISATQRNAATFETFLTRCRAEGFTVEYEEFGVVPAEKQNGPFYSDRSPILICKIFRPFRSEG